MYYRALSYVAGINYKQKKYAVSNYLYAQVFDKCPEMRIVTAYCFHPQNDADWNKSLAMAKTNKEKRHFGQFMDFIRMKFRLSGKFMNWILKVNI